MSQKDSISSKGDGPAYRIKLRNHPRQPLVIAKRFSDRHRYGVNRYGVDIERTSSNTK